MSTEIHTSRFTSPLVIGERVTGISSGPTEDGGTYETAFAGIYEGVRPSEWDGEPIHFFRDGIMGETPQACFGIPVAQTLGITVHPQTVPTTGGPFHPSATHVDALGMPVAFGEVTFADGETERWTYHPTPCCGASASISDEAMYCKACYEEVDDAFGNVPVEPFRPIAEVVA